MIICIGETVIDYIDGKSFIGGSILNVAKAAARQGRCVSYVSEISADENGQRVLSDLIDNCIMFDPQMCNSPYSTMISKAVVKDGTVSYEFSKEGSTAVNISSEKIVSSIKTNSHADCIVLGSIMFANKASRSEILKALKEIGETFVFFDPNVRPDLIENRDEYVKAVSDFAGVCDIFKCSDEDLQYLGFDEKELLKLVKSDLIITYGKNGCRWLSKDGTVICQSAFSAGKVVDTVGCGDTFSGALVAFFDLKGKFGNLDRKEKKEALEWASKAAAINCLEAGCNPPDASAVGNWNFFD